MTVLIETSILVRQADAPSTHQATAVGAMATLASLGELLVIFPQNMVEFWAVATRPRSANGLGLSPADAEAERLRLETLFELLPDPPGLYARWVSLVNQFSVSGKPTHDARIAAAMLEHGITHVLTFNGADFQRFSALGIIIIDPANI